MNVQKLPRADALKHFSQIERRFIISRATTSRRLSASLKRIRASICRNSRRTLMITACAVALLATTANAQSSFSAPALFNQANAAQREGRLGPAILGYERARLLSPNESSIKQNLRIAREKAGVNAPAIPLWQRPAYWLGFDGWASHRKLCALHRLCVVFRNCNTFHVARQSGLAASCGTLRFDRRGGDWSSLERTRSRGDSKRAHNVHIAPAADAQGTFELKAGDLVTAKREYGDFVLVRTLDQRSGWVNKSDLERVIPKTNLSPM